MKIEKLDIKGFGKLHNLIIEFSKGFNLVYGGNEAGKTTVQWFIRGMLYSLKRGKITKSGNIPPLKRYSPWQGNFYGGSIVYTLDRGALFTVERDFNNNTVKVYDSFFNDISDSFKKSKDSGPLFALEHLGINEACFERTVFISQMDTRIDAAGSRELVDKLTNIRETGSEEISLKRAREALKDSLINYVGTERSTTRPLDIVNLKLNELWQKKKYLIEEKEKIFDIEEKVRRLYEKKRQCEKKREAITWARKVIELRRNIEKMKKQKRDIALIIKEANRYEQERDILNQELELYNRMKEQYEPYSKYAGDDPALINILYNKLEDALREKERLYKKLEELMQEIEEAKGVLEEYKAFDSFDEGIENRMQNLADSIKSLEQKKEDIKSEALNENSKASYKLGLITAGIVTSIILTLLSGLFAVIFPQKAVFTALTFVFALLMLIFIFMGKVIKNNLQRHDDSRNMLLSRIQEIDSELSSKQEEIQRIFSMVGAENTGDFIKKKALYENKILNLDKLNSSMEELEREMEENRAYIKKIKTLMLDRFRTCAIIALEEKEIKPEHIETFRLGLAKYAEALENIKRLQEKKEDIQRYLQSLYERASSLFGESFAQKEDLPGALGNIDRKVNDLYEKIDEYSVKIQDTYGFADASPEYHELMEKIYDEEFQNAESYIEDLLSGITDEIDKIVLQISRDQALAERGPIIEDEIQEIEAKLTELEGEKERLQGIGFSLKTALDILEEAAIEIKREFAPSLNRELGSIAGLITQDKYSEVRADDSLILKTLEPDTGRIVEAPSLSGGTVEQLYLALRLALAKTIEDSGEVLPLIMDEVFAHYDDQRVLSTLKMLFELSKERQIIFFTCKDREMEAALEIFGKDLNIIKLGA